MIFRELNRRSKAFLPVALVLVALELTFLLLGWQKYTVLASDVVVNTDILDRVERLLIALDDAQTGQRGFLLTERDEYLEPYRRGEQDAPGELSALRQAAASSSEQRERVAAIGPLVFRMLELLRLSVEARKSQTGGAAQGDNLDEGKRVMDAIRKSCRQIQTAAYEQLARDTSLANRSLQRGVTAAIAGSMLIFLILAIAMRVIGRTNQERARLIDDLQERSDLLLKKASELRRSLAEKTASDQRFQVVVEASPNALIMAGADGLITLVNRQAEKLFGYGRDELLGKPMEMLVPDRFRADPGDLRSSFFAMPAARTMGEGRDLFGLRKDGSEVPVEIGLNPIVTADGSFVLASVIDITWRKQVENELQSRAAEMERFTYTVSHDLKSPLITIKSYIAMIDRDLAAGNFALAQPDLERVARAADKMHGLLEEVLKLSRVGRVENTIQTLPFEALAAEAVELVTGGISEKHIRVEIAPDLPFVTGDRHRLIEVLQNLLDNAAKFMGNQEAPEILIGALNDGKETRFFVKDNGCGVEPKYHQKIFGLFDKLDAKTEGSGAGLAIVKRIIETHGGRIWIESRGAGCGSTFFFTLAGSSPATQSAIEETYAHSGTL